MNSKQWFWRKLSLHQNKFMCVIMGDTVCKDKSSDIDSISNKDILIDNDLLYHS